MVARSISSAILAVSLLALPLQVKARKIGRIVILECGLSAEPENPYLSRACKKFRPTVKQVKNYFLKAYPVPKRFSLHERYSGCYATGTIEFDNFGKAGWSLSSGGTATIEWNETEIVDVFYKRYSWTDPNACSYGMSSEPEC